MRSLAATLLASVLLTSAGAARAQALWGGAEVGMSVDQVRRLYPHASATPGRETDPVPEVLQAPAPPLGGKPTTARFLFRAGGLIAVQLEPRVGAGNTQANVEIAKRLAQDYTVRLGQAYDCGDFGSSNIAEYQCKWLNGEVAVRLWYLDVAGQAPVLRLRFRRADDPSLGF